MIQASAGKKYQPFFEALNLSFPMHFVLITYLISDRRCVANTSVCRRHFIQFVEIQMTLVTL